MLWVRYLLIVITLGVPQLCLADDVLDAFVGEYPFEQKNGRTVFDIPKLKDSMQKLLGSERTKLIRSFESGVPIEAVQDANFGRLIYVWQCQQHNCPKQAGLFLHPDGEAVAACFSDLDDNAEATTDWIGQDWKTTTRGFDCGAGNEALKRLNDAKANLQGKR